MLLSLLLTGQTNKEFNMRHDWNSILSDDESLLLKHYSKEFFPPADTMVSYFIFAGLSLQIYLFELKCF